MWADNWADTAHARLGFAFAVVVISLLVNVDWRHYIRYYGGGNAPSQRKSGIFRVIALLFLVSAFLGLIQESFRATWTFEDAGYSLVLAMMMLGAFGLLDGIMRLYLRSLYGPLKRSNQ